MIRVLLFFAAVALVALGATWLADHPGTVLVSWAGQDYQFSTLVALIAILVIAIVLMLAWTLIRFVFSIPAILSVAGKAKRRNRGLNALSRGMLAVGAGDAGAATRHAEDANRLLRHEPMTLLLKAQAAQLAGDRSAAQSVFAEMLSHDDTRMLGLRGLHVEAQRRGDGEAAFGYASEAHAIAALPWAGQAVLQHRVSTGDWAGALAAVDRNAGARVIDRPTANRQRAVLQTAIAMETETHDPEEALRLIREALRVASTLVPAAALAGRLLSRRGDLRKAAKAVEVAFAAQPHPDLATVYLGLRQGDSATDRLKRAETLARQAPSHPESQLTVARAALEARDFVKARKAMQPLTTGEGNRPTARTCLMMADIEEAEHGETGALFEWLQRAARAPHDPAWIADGVITDTWAPASPVTGQIDAFRWETPNEKLNMPEHVPVLTPHARDLSQPERLMSQQAISSEESGLEGPGTSVGTDPQDAADPTLPAAQTAQPEPLKAGPPALGAMEPLEASYLPSAEPATSQTGAPPFAGAPDDPGSLPLQRWSFRRRNRTL